MGQYYRCAVLEKNYKENLGDCIVASLSPYDYNNGAKLMEHSYVGNDYVGAFCQLIGDENKDSYFGNPVAWVGDYADKKEGVDIYSLAHEAGKEQKHIDVSNLIDYKYIVNFTKKQYVEVPDFDENTWTIHPLPLLIADGNGCGGGDYCGDNEDMVGTWAYDCIGMTNHIPEGFEKLDVEFKEER